MKPRGRCVSIEPLKTSSIDATEEWTVVLRHEKGFENSRVTSPVAPCRVGDIVELLPDGKGLRVLTPGRAGTTKWMDRILDPRRLRGIETRTRVEGAIREFFLGQGFRETRTPTLVPCPGMEVHIRPFRVEQGGYLPTSPEFAMKRLLVGGLERIFQICPAFRYEPLSTTHHPEFTLLEWYRAYAGYEDIMRDTEELFESIALKLFGKPALRFQGKEISVKTPWPRLRVRDLFRDLVGVDLVASSELESMRRECARLGLAFAPEDTWDDLYFRIWLNLIEPRLPENQAVFVLRYPPSQAALAQVDQDPDGSRWAKRFELYAAGLELGNAFEELTDPGEQRQRFVDDMDLRERIYGKGFPKNPLDEEFLHALGEGLPPAGGIAVGVDRMVMLFADEPDIRYTQWLPSYMETPDSPAEA